MGHILKIVYGPSCHDVGHNVVVLNLFGQRVSQVVACVYKPNCNPYLVNTLLDVVK